MALQTKLEQRLVQKLILTPTLQQAIKLLQLTRLELREILNTELQSNPVLEDVLSIEIVFPEIEKVIFMVGNVKWSREAGMTGREKKYEIGVRLMSVNGEHVEKTVTFDEIHGIYWSNVMEAVFDKDKHVILENITKNKK